MLIPFYPDSQSTQAIRRSNLDYIIIRPYGLVDAREGCSSDRGIDVSQGKEGTNLRSIARRDVARACAEALRTPPGQRLTFECWSTNEHKRGIPWGSLKPDPKEGIVGVNHDLAMFTTIGGATLLGGGIVHVVARSAVRMARWWMR